MPIIPISDIDKLKASWRADPCWDIEDTEGFESIREELVQYRLECERKWEEAYQEKLRTYANQIGLDAKLRLAEYIRNLERRVEKLSKQLDLLHDRI
jgi:bacterioferritin (cytochrome b1)